MLCNVLLYFIIFYYILLYFIIFYYILLCPVVVYCIISYRLTFPTLSWSQLKKFVSPYYFSMHFYFLCCTWRRASDGFSLISMILQIISYHHTNLPSIISYSVINVIIISTQYNLNQYPSWIIFSHRTDVPHYTWPWTPGQRV